MENKNRMFDNYSMLRDSIHQKIQGSSNTILDMTVGEVLEKIQDNVREGANTIQNNANKYAETIANKSKTFFDSVNQENGSTILYLSSSDGKQDYWSERLGEDGDKIVFLNWFDWLKKYNKYVVEKSDDSKLFSVGSVRRDYGIDSSTCFILRVKPGVAEGEDTNPQDTEGDQVTPESAENDSGLPESYNPEPKVVTYYLPTDRSRALFPTKELVESKHNIAIKVLEDKDFDRALHHIKVHGGNVAIHYKGKQVHIVQHVS